jgi:hypothetical protein
MFSGYKGLEKEKRKKEKEKRKKKRKKKERVKIIIQFKIIIIEFLFNENFKSHVTFKRTQKRL